MPEPRDHAGVGSAQVLISPPGTTFRVGQGPYTVPLSIVNAARLSMVTLTLTYDPALLRVRAVQEGSFMRTGGASCHVHATGHAGSRGRDDYALRRRDRRVGNRPARRRRVRCDCARQRHADAERYGHGTGQYADGPAVQAGNDRGASRRTYG